MSTLIKFTQLLVLFIFQLALCVAGLFCVYGFTSSFEFPGLNKGHIVYGSMIILTTILIACLATNKFHKATSYILILILYGAWFFMLLRVWQLHWS